MITPPQLSSLLPTGLVGKVLVGLAVLVAVVLLGMGIYFAGHLVGHAECTAETAKRDTSAISKAHKDYAAEVVRGRDAVIQLNKKLAGLEAENAQLEERTKHVPRVIASAERCPDPGAVHLTGAGLLRWNTALGHPNLSASACGADGAAAGLCAADTGISLVSAQLNAEENFRRGTEIRARCQALIDHLNKQQAREGASNE